MDTPIPGLTLNATDRDTVATDSIHYTLVGVPGCTADNFYIGPASNQIAVAKEMWLMPGHVSTLMTVLVHVVDEGGLTDEADVNITIYDINNHVPMFLEPEYNISIYGKFFIL